MVNVRDIVSSVLFYTGAILLGFLLLRVGSRYGFYSVHEDFRLMEPRLQRGSHVVVDKFRRTPEDLTYGDIIMYRRPAWKRAAWSYEFARVVGKPGDVVELRRHRLYRAERREGALGPLEMIGEPYVDPRDMPKDFSAVLVPRNCVFVLHDNRRRREPLRDLIVPARAIRGRVR